jgi:hypothetical protein
MGETVDRRTFRHQIASITRASAKSPRETKFLWRKSISLLTLHAMSRAAIIT